MDNNKMSRIDEAYRLAREKFDLECYQEAMDILNGIDESLYSADLYELRAITRLSLCSSKSMDEHKLASDLYQSDMDTALGIRYGSETLQIVKQSRELDNGKKYQELISLIESLDGKLLCPELIDLHARAEYQLLIEKGEHDPEILSKIFAIYDVETEYSKGQNSLERKANSLTNLIYHSLGYDQSNQPMLQFNKGEISYQESINGRQQIIWSVMNEIKSCYDIIISSGKDTNHKFRVAQVFYDYCRFVDFKSNDQISLALDIAYNYIREFKDIESDGDAQWYHIRILKDMGYYDDALEKIDEYYKDCDEDSLPEYATEKAITLFERGNLTEALLMVDQALFYKDETSLEDQNPDENLLNLKLKIYLGIRDYNSYAKLISELLDKGVFVDLVRRVSVLLHNKQYDVVLNHFDRKIYKSSILKWFCFWCNVCLSKQRESTNEITDLKYNALFKELTLINKRLYWLQLGVEKLITELFSVARFDLLDDMNFFFILWSIFDDDISFEKFGAYLNARQSHNRSIYQLRQELLYEIPLKKNRKRLHSSYMWQAMQNILYLDIMRESTNELQQAKFEERNRILANLSHSIKNMLKAVIDPLLNLRKEIPQKSVIIDNAIKGANLIREIVNAINLSFQTTLEELKWDVLNPGCESMTLQDMVVDSLRYSVSNMFDSRYFPAFSEKYFPRSLAKVQYEKIRSNWNEVSAGDIPQIKGFLDKHMFRLELNLDESQDYHVGNDKSSAIKLLILFQEIIFNAVKYTAYVPFPERRVEITLASHGDKMVLAVKNSFDPKVQAKTTGVGKLVIENFAKVLGCDPVITEGKDTYSISLEFDNLWQRIAADA